MKIHPHKQAQPVQTTSEPRGRAHCKSRRTIKNHQQQRLLSSARPTRGLCSLVYKSIECKLQQHSDLSVICILFLLCIHLPVAWICASHMCACVCEWVHADNIKVEQVAYRKCRILKISILHAKLQLLSVNKEHISAKPSLSLSSCKCALTLWFLLSLCIKFAKWVLI